MTVEWLNEWTLWRPSWAGPSERFAGLVVGLISGLSIGRARYRIYSPLLAGAVAVLAGDDHANPVRSMFRARAIQTDLINAGVSEAVAGIDYYGTNDPRVPRPRGVPEPENRRVEVTIR